MTGKSAGDTTHIKIVMAAFWSPVQLANMISAGGTLKWSAFICKMNHTCAFPAMTNQNLSYKISVLAVN